MQNLWSQIKGCFIVAGLPAQLNHSQQQFNQQLDRQALTRLIQLALLLFVAALLLWISADYHAGFHFFNQLTPLLPSQFWQIATFMGDTTFVLTLALLVARRKPELLWVLFIAAIYGTLVTHGLKMLFDMQRPPVALMSDEYHLVGKALRNGSFPSGHSFTAFAFASVAYYFFNHRSLRWALLLLGGFVGFSRIMVAAHWPIDVLVGGGLGMLVTVAAIQTARWSHVGFRRPMHFFIVFLLLVAALMIMFGHTGGYPQAQLFAKAIAFTALLVFIWEYFLPVRASRAN
ncbi:phosphatase PAP2 family protein [Amphritea sp. 1_MG-2023]|uniref:phosphatase PAP2 family protein n=1 Tax=Amphritea sp. 1_MG-2023 TaxID=3062670 RepID=UPI0026E39F29|nr:phosphatase PAP2 family protein [Amphritea sp. 1_MG-2023]MDO6563283.1 phosphatase PAP2 family protein [Amphritea sp. 1_MG-2023]